MHQECGLPFIEIGSRLACSPSSAHRWAMRHADIVAEGGEFDLSFPCWIARGTAHFTISISPGFQV